MYFYQAIGHSVGTPEAIDLASRLAAWHDAMVRHQRRAAFACDSECPHAEARALWHEAVEVFGERARELGFLYTQGHARSSARGAASPAPI